MIPSALTGILTVILIWGFYEIIGKKLDREAFILPKKINALLSIVMFTIVIMFVYFTYIIQEAADIRYPHVAIGLAIVGGIIGNFIKTKKVVNSNQKAM